MYTEDYNFIDYILDYIFWHLITFVIYVLPVLICAGAVVAMVFYIRKKKEKSIFTCVVLSFTAVLCMSFWGWRVYQGRPYSREPITENVELVAEERNRADFPISDEDLNAAFETCIDYFKSSGDYEFCELIGLRYLYMYSPGGNDVVMIEVRYNSGFFSNVTHYGKFYKLERDRNSNEWVFDSVNTAP